MATYDKEIDYINSEVYFKLKDRSIYGSSRVGVRSTDIDMLALHNPNYSMKSVKYEIGKRTYELSNHLGNVLSVISDKPIPSFEGGNLGGMLADVRVAQDYSPFGVTLSGRNFEVDGGYRYQFNGMEKDDEVKGRGNSYDFGARMYDSRLGRFLSIDPLALEFPFASPYCYALNSPIMFIDANGEGPGDPPIVSFDASANSKVVSAYALQVIYDIGQQANIKNIYITSTYRSPERQIQVMYYNCALKNGVSKGYATYGKKGDAVVKAYEESVAKGLTKNEIINEMTKIAEKIGFGSDHSKSNYGAYNVIDLSYRNLSQSEYQALKAAAKNDPRITKVFGKEEGDNALHIEIPIPITQQSTNNQPVKLLDEIIVNGYMKLEPKPNKSIEVEIDKEIIKDTSTQ